MPSARRSFSASEPMPGSSVTEELKCKAIMMDYTPSFARRSFSEGGLRRVVSCCLGTTGNKKVESERLHTGNRDGSNVFQQVAEQLDAPALRRDEMHFVL